MEINIEGLTLYKEQLEVVDFTINRFNCILALQAGYGKTLCSLVSCEQILKNKDINILILCPSEANKAFKKELSLLNRDYSIHTVQEEKTRKSPYTILNHSSVKKFHHIVEEKTKKPCLLLMDEAHKLANKSSSLNKYLREIRPMFRATLLLTATPLLNKLEGLFQLVDFARPGYLGNEYQFYNNYVLTKKGTRVVNGKKMTYSKIVGYKNQHLLKDKLINKIMIIRQKEYNLEFKVLQADMSNVEKDSYNKASSGIMEGYDEFNPMDYGARLHQLQLVSDNAHPTIQGVSMSNKERLLLKTVKEIADRNEAMIIYVEYKESEKRISKLIGHFRKDLGIKDIHKVTGEIKKEVRYEVEDKIKPKDVIIISRAGVQSMNLQRANNIICYNTPFAVGFMVQLVGRVCRIDSKYNSQTVIMLENKDTIDTYKVEIMKGKAKMIKDIIGGVTTLPDEDVELKEDTQRLMKFKYLWNKR